MMRNRNRSEIMRTEIFATLALMIGSITLSCGSGIADVIVVYSDVSGIQRGQELPDDNMLDIPSGKLLSVLSIQNSELRQRQIEGPRRGAVKELFNSEAVSPKLWSALVSMIRKPDPCLIRPAVTRALSSFSCDHDPREKGVWLKTGWKSEWFASGSVICVEENSTPEFSRAVGRNKLTNEDGTQSAPLKFPGAWPKSIPIKDGSTYVFWENGVPTSLKLNIVPTGTLTGGGKSIQSLEALAAHGCTQQLNAALRDWAFEGIGILQ
jgi:hypothetical protein